MGDNVSLAIAFSAGLLSFLSPCVLAMVPVYLASLQGPVAREGGVGGGRLPQFLHSLAFTGGFSVVFIGLGAIAGLTGFALRVNYALLSQVAGGLLIAFGLFMLASLKVPWLNFERRLTYRAGRATGYLRSFLIGSSFSLGWSACVGPILAGILVLASIRETAWHGAFLLSVYSLGLALPFLAMGLAFDSLAPLLRRVRAHAWIVCLVSGLMLIGVGILVMTNNLVRLFSLVR